MLKTPTDGEKREHSLSKFIYVICDKRQRGGKTRIKAVPFVRVVGDNRPILHALMPCSSDKKLDQQLKEGR
jgi:hypothetical protein